MTERERCPTCDRLLPVEKADDPSDPRQKRKRFSLLIPAGEEGVLDDLLAQLVERYKPAWPGIEISEQGWRYRALHLALHTALHAPLPAEEGA